MKLNDLVPNPGSKKIANVLDAVHPPVRGKPPAAVTKGQGRALRRRRPHLRPRRKPAVHRRLPFMRGEGFTPPNQVTYNEVNLDQLSESFKANADVNLESLEAAHLLRDPRNPWSSWGAAIESRAQCESSSRQRQRQIQDRKSRRVLWN